MKNIYHIHQSSNSYWDSHWTDTDYYLCDSEEEYQQKLAEYTEERKQIEKDFKENPTEANKYRALFFQLSKEQKVHANEYMNGAARSSMLSVSAGVRGWREVRITSTILSQARCATRQEVPLLADLQDMEVKLNKIGGETCRIK